MTNRALWLAASLVTPACATTATNDLSTLPAANGDDARIAELESRIVYLEGELEAARRTSVRAQSVRVDAGRSEPEADPVAAALLAEGPVPDVSSAHDAEEAPVVLRLHEERPAPPLPVITERLPVAPMPAPVQVVAPTPPTAPFPHVTTASSVVAPAATAPASLAAILPSAANVPTIAATPTTATPATEHTGDYRLGLGHLTARRYEEAIVSLSSFLRDHPGSPRSGDAMYWRATANYALHRYGDALIDYERVPRIAPRGEHAADAIYHAGLCHRRLGADARARSSFERVRRDYPESAAARLAAREEST